MLNDVILVKNKKLNKTTFMTPINRQLGYITFYRNLNFQMSLLNNLLNVTNTLAR